ncbi:MAG: ABC transporter permease [Proteobacteria bacterium]|nr:MAG: ABC transporter permease [Pseudomonadota bacterium]
MFPGLKKVFPFALVAKIADTETRVYATAPDLFSENHLDLPSLEQGTAPKAADDLVVGSAVAQVRHIKLNDKVDASAWDQNSLGTSFRVVGILKPTGLAWDGVTLTSLAAAEKIYAGRGQTSAHPWGNHVIHFMLVFVTPEAMPKLLGLINQRTVAQAVSVTAAKAQLDDLTGTSGQAEMLLAATVLLLGLSSVASMMILRYEKAKTELAILQALGRSRAELATLLVFEATLIAVPACIVGALFDAALFPFVKTLLDANVLGGGSATVSLWQSAPAWVAAILGIYASVLYPIWRISKQNIHRSLRSL